MPEIAYLVFPIVIVSSVVLFFFLRFRIKKRKKELKQIADQLGYSYAESGRETLAEWRGDFPLLKPGRHHVTLSNVMKGSLGDFTFTLFDYRYTARSRQGATPKFCTAVIFHSPQFALPSFDLKPEGFKEKLASAVGFQDIDFEGFPEFSRRYLLKGKNESQVRSVFTKNVLSRLENHPGWAIESSGRALLMYRGFRTCPAEKIRYFIEEASALARLFR